MSFDFFLISTYKYIGIIFFYIYLYSYVFDFGMLHGSPIGIFFKNLKNPINNIIYKYNVFPAWQLFLRLNDKKFYDLVITTKTTCGKQYKWILIKDKKVGNLKFKNKTFATHLVSHYNYNSTYINRIFKQAVSSFLKEKGEIIETLSVRNLEFDLDAKDSDIENRDSELKLKNLEKFDFVWHNPNAPKFAKIKNNYDIL
jgi:hypothetical protein